MKDSKNIFGNARKLCILYEEVHQILGTLVTTCPSAVVVSGGGGSSVTDVDVTTFEDCVRVRGRPELERERTGVRGQDRG